METESGKDRVAYFRLLLVMVKPDAAAAANALVPAVLVI